jgi:hypothetical protein
MTASTPGLTAKALSEVRQLFVPFARRAGAAIRDHVWSVWVITPPQPSRTRAKSFNTWVRRQGHYPKSYFTAAGGGFKIKNLSTAQRGKLKLTSEDLEENAWGSEVTPTGGGVEISVWNGATYSPYVIGDKQAGFHHETGWKTDAEALAEAMPGIEKIEGEVISAFIQELVKN